MPDEPTASSSARQGQNERGLTRRVGRDGGLRRTLKSSISWLTISHSLENKGSVARDHLALERTYLAWLRTSLSLASIGVAITQLFRLQTISTDSNGNTTISLASITRRATSAPRTTTSEVEELRALLAQYASRLATLEQNAIISSVNGHEGGGLVRRADPGYDPQKYRHLGKPVGGVFIATALLFLVMGTHRFFKVQRALMKEPSQFPPSRRSVAGSTFVVAGIVLAAFAAILATK